MFPSILAAAETSEQKAWYVKKSESQGDYMKREYPSTPLEAFEQSMEGAYFTKQMIHVRKNGQVTHVQHEPSKRVTTYWDLGMNDMLCIWFFQQVGNELRMIDYYENNGEGLQHYADVLAKKGYVYEEHVWPHDGAIRDLSTGKTRRDTAQGLGIMPIRIIPQTKSVNDDIQKVRNILPKIWFDKERCDVGIKHLDNYRKEWDERLACWKNKPRHDEASHGADAFRAFAVGYREPITHVHQHNDHVVHVAEDYNALDY